MMYWHPTHPINHTFYDPARKIRTSLLQRGMCTLLVFCSLKRDINLQNTPPACQSKPTPRAHLFFGRGEWEEQRSTSRPWVCGLCMCWIPAEAKAGLNIFTALPILIGMNISTKILSCWGLFFGWGLCHGVKMKELTLRGLSGSAGQWHWESCKQQHWRPIMQPVPKRHVLNEHEFNSTSLSLYLSCHFKIVQLAEDKSSTSIYRLIKNHKSNY